MKTDYFSHDEIYRKRREHPDYAGWNKHEDTTEDWQSTWQPLMQKQAFPKQGRLLELGCGAGNVSIEFAKVGYEVTGVEISPTAISWAADNAAKAKVNVNFLQGDVLRLEGIEDESFDVVVDGRCLHCIIGDDRDRYLQSARRALTVGGILTICTMCNEVPETDFFKKFFDLPSRCTIHDGTARRYIGDSNEILQEVIRAGFRLLDVEVKPPQGPEDLADLILIAERRSFSH